MQELRERAQAERQERKERRHAWFAERPPEMQRLLLRTDVWGDGPGPLFEARYAELSPSGWNVRLALVDGTFSWHPVDELDVIEVLPFDPPTIRLPAPPGIPPGEMGGPAPSPGWPYGSAMSTRGFPERASAMSTRGIPERRR
jgi:hypothetical protein